MVGENGFNNFYNWAMNNGYRDDLTLDRIDVNKHYEPSNCRWATRKEQANNRRSNTHITINGITKNMKEWEEEFGLPQNTILARLSLGWQGEDLLKPIKNQAEKISGIKNITWNKGRQKWQVLFKENGKLKNIGTFKELADTIKAKEKYLKEKNENRNT
jgi:hypothetical protein